MVYDIKKYCHKFLFEIAGVKLSLFLFLTLVCFAQVDRYELGDLNGNAVYFPKSNKTYINELLEMKNKDKLLYLADFYIEMHEEELALYYFNSYTGYNTEKKLEISKKLGIDFLTKGLKIETYTKEKDFSEYNAIDSLNDVEKYIKYFANGGDKEKNDYEKLFRLKFEKKEKEFHELYEKLLKEAGDKKDETEIFIIKLLNEDYMGAKELAMSKPDLFLNLIKMMKFNKVDKILIKSFVKEFKKSYSNIHEKDMALIELEMTENNEEKIEISKTYLNKNFDADIFEIYYKLDKSSQFLKEYLINLIFKKNHEKYITYLINIDSTFETEEYLEKLFNKSYYFQYLEKQNKEIPSKYQENYIEYLLDEEKYDLLLKYKENLSFENLKKLFVGGYKEEALNIIRNKYPLKIEYADLNQIKYFFFNKNYVFDEELVKELLIKKQLNSIEIYYLSRYYMSTGKNEQAHELEYALKDNYNLNVYEN